MSDPGESSSRLPARAKDAWLEVVAGLVFRHSRLLITQRRAGDPLGGLWEFPGGKLETGETAVEGLARELREELGVEVRVGARLAVVEHRYPERSVRLQFFRCTLLRGEPQPIGCAATAWITAAELRHYEFPAADAQLLVQLAESPDWWA